MKWSVWKPIYCDIVSQLNLDPKQDFQATTILDELLRIHDSKSLLQNLDDLLNGKIIAVCGAGPSLEKHLEQMPNREDVIIISADGATTALYDNQIQCDVIVTDLDGDVTMISRMVKNGAIPIVHAHGDNISTIKKHVPEFTRVLGSTQVKPTENVQLWGGFTDGDRACFIAAHYNPEKIILLGMDFGKMVGKWSKPEHEMHFPASPRKQKKLRIAKSLIEYLEIKKGVKIVKMS
ncbi:MAG: DUF115 domain-containing protein [Candidatus Lokiarchaeota archaeon]|nr:DUF115 domain-containing protein [Candidatus Lokiarchaeota archaeon]